MLTMQASLVKTRFTEIELAAIRAPEIPKARRPGTKYSTNNIVPGRHPNTAQIFLSSSDYFIGAAVDLNAIFSFLLESPRPLGDTRLDLAEGDSSSHILPHHSHSLLLRAPLIL